MLLGGGGAAGIFGDDQVKTQLPGIAGGGFDADVGGDAAENNGVDTAAAQLKLKNRYRTAGYDKPPGSPLSGCSFPGFALRRR